VDKFRDVYRTASARAVFWNYGSNAAYFVTIVTKNRIHWFGQVVDGEMVLSEVGRIAHACWLEIPDHFPFVTLDAFVVMPDHIHGIVVIQKPDDGRNNDVPTPDANAIVETQNFASLHLPSPPDCIISPSPPERIVSPSPDPAAPSRTQNQFGPQSHNLASVIRGFKVGVTKNARRIHPEFAWQTRYHDRIIRTPSERDRIAAYIRGNPAAWGNGDAI